MFKLYQFVACVCIATNPLQARADVTKQARGNLGQVRLATWAGISTTCRGGAGALAVRATAMSIKHCLTTCKISLAETRGP